MKVFYLEIFRPTQVWRAGHKQNNVAYRDCWYGAFFVVKSVTVTREASKKHIVLFFQLQGFKKEKKIEQVPNFSQSSSYFKSG